MVLTAIFFRQSLSDGMRVAEPEFAARIFKDGPDQVFHGS